VADLGDGGAFHLHASDQGELLLELVPVGPAGEETIAAGNLAHDHPWPRDPAFPEQFRSDSSGQLVAEEPLGGRKRIPPEAGVGCEAGDAEQGHLVPGEQGAGIHVVLVEVAGNDHIPYLQRLVGSPGNSSEDDAAHVKVLDQIGGRGRSRHLAPAGEDEDDRRPPKGALVIGSLPGADDHRVFQFPNKLFDLFPHCAHDSDGHGCPRPSLKGFGKCVTVAALPSSATGAGSGG
jgi:hypothetical protein